MDKVEYKNKTIEYEESLNPKLLIDGEPLQISHDEDAKVFNIEELPYHSFKSVKELAEEIVERRLQHEEEGDG